MTWAKVDDGFWCHPKVLSVSMASRGAWVTMLSWVSKHTTDGAIPRAAARALMIEQEQIAELVAIGLWDETTTGWAIHDFLDFNPSKAELDESKDANRKRVAKHRDRRSRSDGNALPNALVMPFVTAPVTPLPDPGSRIPDPEESVRRAHANRRPLPEPPPDFAEVAEPKNPALAHIRREYSERYMRTYSVPAPSDASALRDLADWCTQAAAMRKCLPAEIASQVLDGFFKTTNTRVRDARHKLAFAARNPTEFLASTQPPRVAPAPEKLPAYFKPLRAAEPPPVVDEAEMRATVAEARRMFALGGG